MSDNCEILNNELLRRGGAVGMATAIEFIEKTKAKIPDITVDEILEELKILREMIDLRVNE